MNKLINLGCGNLKKEGYINVDKSIKCKPDKLKDITKTPYPKDWVDVERYEADNIFEHLTPKEVITVINECHKTLKDGGTLWIRVPELRDGNIMACFTDPTHINYFTNQTFQYFDKNQERHKSFGKDYNIKPWNKVEQVSKSIFLEVTLTK